MNPIPVSLTPAADLLDTVPCGVLSFRDDGRIVLANRTLHCLLGLEHPDLVGRHVDSMLPVASRIFYQTHLFPLLKLYGHVEEVYFTLAGHDGEVPVLVSAVRVERSGEHVSDCILMPMRQRNRYEDEILEAKRVAEEATRAKDEFLAIVSHELRSPLNAILGWVHILKTDGVEPELKARAIEVIERNVESQSRLITDILDLARSVAGKMRLEVRLLEIEPVVNAALDVVRPAAAAREIHLERVFETGTGPVSGDFERLQQVMWNLLSNAVKFTPRGGLVEIRVASVDSTVEISVRDNGRGIRPDFLPHVFDLYCQADESPGRGEAGLGLGMAITKHIVELHGGTIHAQSEGEGHGATFTVRLPTRTEPR